MNDLNQYITKKSRELNIDICGFADSLPMDYLKGYLDFRKDNNLQTEFEEKDIIKRIDPKATLPTCKSIIVIGISYNVDLDTSETTSPIGLLSKSSWGMDYHLVVKKKLELLIQEIKKVTNFEYKYFVDTGPLIDRELARKAGIGYYGKNGSIINDEYGSFIFIGYILTDLDLEFSEVVEEKCGDCDFCIRTCPTNALEGPYKLNPKRCISYLTQTKGEIAYELRKRMGIMIYGCDTCQLVCPKNNNVKKPIHSEFIPLVTKGHISIEELFYISNKEFKSRYGHMAGSWRGKTILKRNAIIALGNIKEEETIDLLIPQLKDENPMIREYAQWAIINIYLTMMCNK